MPQYKLQRTYTIEVSNVNAWIGNDPSIETFLDGASCMADVGDLEGTLYYTSEAWLEAEDIDPRTNLDHLPSASFKVTQAVADRIFRVD